MIDLRRELRILGTTDVRTYVDYVQTTQRMWLIAKLAEREHRRISARLLQELKHHARATP